MSGLPTRIGEHQLSRDDAMTEYMFLGLRLSDGVDLLAFKDEFGTPLESVYGSATADLVRLGLLIQNENVLTLSLRGMLLSNQIFARFMQ